MVAKYGLFSVGALVLVGFGFLVHAWLPEAAYQRPAEFSLLNPIVTSTVNKHFIINFQPLRQQLTEIRRRYGGEARIYFLYLNNAAWVGIDERDTFTAASLVKVPLAMAAYKAVEEGKLSLDTKYGLDEVDLDPGFGDLYKVGEGGTLTLEELIGIMLTHSDNTAANAIRKIFLRIGVPEPLDEVNVAMGWDIVGEERQPNYGVIHVKVLSNMFLSLYNATYVNPEYSQRILTHLTHTLFDQQIVAGVPGGIPVAHKMGIREEDKTYSDCGIVYAPQRDYILCIATSGIEESDSRRLMVELSKASYEYVIKN